MISIYNTFEEELKDLWIELEENSQIPPFQSYNWLLNWHQTAGKKYTLFIACIILEGRIEAIFPFGINSTKIIKRLEWLGGSHADYMSPILRSESNYVLGNFNVLWGEVLASLPRFDVLSLTKQIPKIGNQANPFISIYPSSESMRSYQSVFNGEWGVFKDSVSKKVLADSSRQRKRLSELGELKFNIVNPQEDHLEFLNCMFSFKQQRYKQMGVHDFLQAKGHRNFYINLPATISSTAKVHCSTLTLDDEVIALHWGVTDTKTFFYLMPAHDTLRWSKFSPGKLLLEDLLKWSNENRFSTFDFTGGEESYKKIWSNDSFSIHETNHFFTISGQIYLFLLSQGRKIKNIILNFIRKL
jgi:CelD/BcsL family acetyltransferase involved in cellulose biosynthesis